MIRLLLASWLALVLPAPVDHDPSIQTVGWQAARVGRLSGLLPPPPSPPPPGRAAYLGARLVTNSPGWGQVLRRSDSAGALVVVVVPGAPLEKAGLVRGDVVVGLDGQPISNEVQLVTALRLSPTLEHTLTVVGVGVSARTVGVRAEPRAARAESVFVQRLAGDPAPASRYIFAAATDESSVALGVIDSLIREFPAWPEASALKAERMLHAAQADKDLSGERVAPIKATLASALENGASSVAVQLSAARVFGTLGEVESAERHASEAVAVDPASAEGHHLLGLARLEARQPRAALDELLEAVKLDPYSFGTYPQISRAYRELGATRYAEATDRVVRRAPRNATREAGGRPASAAVGMAVALLVGVATFRRARGGTDTAQAGGTKRSKNNELPEPPLWPVEALAAMGLFSMASAFLGRFLHLSPQASLVTDVVDHFAPGLVISLMAALCLSALVRSRHSSDLLFVTALVAGAFGLWMTGRHLRLITMSAPAEALFFDFLPGPVIVVVALLVYLRLARNAPGTRPWPPISRTRATARPHPAPRTRRG